MQALRPRYGSMTAFPGVLACSVLALLVSAWPSTAQPVVQWAAADEGISAKSWVGRAQEIEEYLKHAEVVKIDDIGTGVTNPKRAYLAPGGPVDRMAWKPIRPGMYLGHWESYKAEIAAYELDKLLELHMVPVKVERRLANELGAAIMWVSPTQSFAQLGGAPTPPSTQIGRWNVQIIRAKMFDNLIYNRDPNLGNWLVDPDWNLMLIDHSRSFTTGRRLAHEITRVDRDLWARMEQLDEAALTAALGEWLNTREIRAILQRRDLMAQEIRKLVAARGEADVLVRYMEPAPAGTAPPPD